MSGDWKPGTVAKVTVRGVPDVTVFRTDDRVDPWRSADLIRTRARMHPDYLVTDVRPLVVLDLDGIVDPAGALRLIANEDVVNAKRSLLLGLANQIEAQTKPPRIPEPGLYGVVSTERDGLTTYRWHSHDGWHGEDGSLHEWDDLIDPVLVREGVTE